MAEYSNCPDLYVQRQEEISFEGRSITRLVCIGNWGRHEKHKIMGDTLAAAYDASSDPDTVEDIINEALISGTVTVDSSDGLEDTTYPDWVFSVQDSRRQIMQWAIETTQNLLFWRDSGLRMKERDDEAAADYTYNLLQPGHTFWEFKRSQSLLEANRIIVVDSLPDSTGTTNTYSNINDQANDTDDQTLFGITTLTVADPYLDSNGACEALGNSILAQFQRNATSGKMLAPMNCGQEVHDLVEITDQRVGISATKLRVGGIIRRFRSSVFGNPEYSIELDFGGKAWQRPEPIEMAAGAAAGIAGALAAGITDGLSTGVREVDVMRDWFKGGRDEYSIAETEPRPQETAWGWNVGEASIESVINRSGSRSMPGDWDLVGGADPLRGRSASEVLYGGQENISLGGMSDMLRKRLEMRAKWEPIYGPNWGVKRHDPFATDDDFDDDLTGGGSWLW
jgi:hypothetical protein